MAGSRIAGRIASKIYHPGAITTILRRLGLEGDERKRVGQVANEIKDEIQSAHDQRKRSLDEAA
jgi:hypothetical protein